MVNFVVVTHILYRAFCRRPYEKRLVVPLVLLSIPMAVGIHTVTAFLYNGLAARPYWNSSILAPQFLASAFCSGPAILLVVLQLLRRFTRFEIQDQAIWKIAELMAYAMFLNLFLHGAEAFKEYYSDTEHLLYTRYWFQGLGEHRTLVPYAWTAVALNLAAFVLFIVPAARRNRLTLNLGCLATYAGVLHREGHGPDHPGLDPRHAGRDLRVLPVDHRAAGGGRGLRGRLPGVHADAQGGGADLARRVPGRGRIPRPRRRPRDRLNLKETLLPGEIGQVTSVDFSWYLDTSHGADYFRRWHRLREKSGSLWVHKATHHFDLVNWWLDADPVEVSALASLNNYGKKGPFHYQNCDDRLRDLIFRKVDAPEYMKLPGSRAGAMSCLTGIAARKSADSGRPVQIADLVRL